MTKPSVDFYIDDKSYNYDDKLTNYIKKKLL